jgi:antitoxin ChpS
MHTTTLRKVGGSVMLAVPPAILDILELRAGTTVGIVVDGGRLIVEPERRPRYSIDELLARCDANAEVTEEELSWLAGAPVGDELI